MNTDVVVIGAGYAGIAAGKALYAADIDFRIVEARERIGGRTQTMDLQSGATVDLGAQWIGPEQHRVWNWVRETGTETYECYDSGKNILGYRNKISRYKGTIPKIDPLSLLDLGQALFRLKRASDKTDIEQPWHHPDAAKLDGMTVQSWMDLNMWTSKAKFLFKIGIETVFAAEPSEISALGALFYARSGGDMEKLLAVSGGAQQTLLTNGTQRLAERVASEFSDRITVGQPVLKISQSNYHAIVHTKDQDIRCRYIISTVPPALWNRIEYEPGMDQRRKQLGQRMPMGAAMKCFCIYERPFWRDKGLSGQIVCDEAPIKVTFDCSKSNDSHGIILAFAEADDARTFIGVPKEKRQEAVIEGLVKYFGPEARNVLDYTDKCWTEEEWSQGCYAGLMPPGLITSFKGLIREPEGRIHFAGTETATRWNGYLDGAIQSGERAAAEVRDRLR